MANSKKNPVHEVRLGRVRAAVWENDTKNGAMHNVTLTRLYKDDDDDSESQISLPLKRKVM